MQPVSSKYKFRLKNFDKKLGLKSDNTSPCGDSEKENPFAQMEILMNNFAKIFSEASENMLKIQENMKLLKVNSEQVDQNQKIAVKKSKSCMHEIKRQLHSSLQNVQKKNQEKNEEHKENINGKIEMNQLCIEQRFRYIQVPVIELQNKVPQSEERNCEITDWLSQICKKIFSASFKQLLEGNLSSKVVKVYCSQNLLLRLIEFIRKNNLNSQEVAHINKFLKDTLLPYFQLKYPQSQTNQVNLRLSNKIQKIDNYSSNTNDLVFRSGTNFQYSQKGQYNQYIMCVLNHMISLANDNIKIEKKNIEQIEKKQFIQKIKMEYCAKNNQNYEQKNKQNKDQAAQVQNDDDLEENTLYTAFYNDMEDLFKKLQDDEEVMRMKTGISPLEFAQKNKKLVLQKKDPTKKQIYKEKVKQYTKYLIGRKISQSVDEFTFEEIKGGSLLIKNSQILRILNKWCNHLKEKFEQTEFSIQNRDEPFRMQDGSQGYLSKTHRIILSRLMGRQHQNIMKYLQNVMKNSYEFQEMTAKKKLNKKFDWFSKEQSTIGMFTSTLFYNNQNYIIGYLNTLIHSLLVTGNDFNQIINLVNRNNLNSKTKEKLTKLMQKVCTNKKSIDDLMNFVRDKNKNSKKIFYYEEVPQLVTFRIGDLCRCKCSSKQREITAVYRQIMRISQSHPALWKVIRIKNRLLQGTKDILINLAYRQKIIVEIQLQVDQAKSKFIVCSSSFKHYLYELGRAQFGPISQMSSIWMNHDNRGQFFRDYFGQQNTRQSIEGKSHNCFENIPEDFDLSIPIRVDQKFPFICSLCNKLWTHTNFIETHDYCNICQKHICGYCLVDLDIKITEPNFRAALGNILNEDKQIKYQSTRLPDFGASMRLYAKDTVVRQFRKIYYEYKKYLFEVLPNDTGYRLMAQVTTPQDVTKFLKENKVLSLQDELYSNYQGNQKEKEQKKMVQNIKIAQQYFLPKQFDQILNEKKTSILQQRKNISDKTFQIITRCPDVTKINFSQNQIETFDNIIEHFPKIEIAVLAINKFQSLPTTISNIASSLNYLDLNRNQIKILPKQIVELTQLKQLNLSHNQLKEIPNNFSELKNLKALKIGYNHLSFIESLPIGLKKLDLQHNKFQKSINILELQDLIVLNLAFNKLKNVDGLEDTKTLKTLDLSNNMIHNPEFINLYSLQNLNISYNNAEDIIVRYQDASQSSLRNLNASFNKLTKLSDEFYRNIYKIESLSLANNKLEYISQGIYNLSNLEQLNLSAIRSIKIQRKKNKKRNQDQISFQKKISENTVPKLSNFCQEPMKQNYQLEPVPGQILPQECHNYLTRLNCLNLSNNKLTYIPETISKMVQLKQLDLSSNGIKKIDVLLTVDVLDLSTNKLKEFTVKTAEYLNTLKVLYLKNNKKLPTIDVNQIKTVIKNLQEIDCLAENNSQSSLDSRRKSNPKISSKKSSKSMTSDDQSSQCSNRSIEDNLVGENDINELNEISNTESLNIPKINHLHQRIPSSAGKRKKIDQIQETIAQEADKEEYDDQNF